MAPHLLNLPREIRNEIYESLLFGDINTEATSWKPIRLTPSWQPMIIGSANEDANRSPAYNLSLVCHQIRAELLDQCERKKSQKSRYVVRIDLEASRTVSTLRVVMVKWIRVPLLIRPHIDVLEIVLQPLPEDRHKLWNIAVLWVIVYTFLLLLEASRARQSLGRLSGAGPSPKLSIGTLRFIHENQFDNDPVEFPFMNHHTQSSLSDYLRSWPALTYINATESYCRGKTTRWDVRKTLRSFLGGSKVADLEVSVMSWSSNGS